MSLDKSKLGQRYICFSCGTKFYDLNRPTALCPECGGDQAEAPARDIKALIAKGKKARRDAGPEEASEEIEEDDGLFDDADDDDNDNDDEDDELGDLEDED